MTMYLTLALIVGIIIFLAIVFTTSLSCFGCQPRLRVCTSLSYNSS